MSFQGLISFDSDINEVQSGDTVVFTYTARSNGVTSNERANLTTNLATLTPNTFTNDLVDGINTVDLTTKIAFTGSGIMPIVIQIGGEKLQKTLKSKNTSKQDIIDSILNLDNIATSNLYAIKNEKGVKYFKNKNEIYDLLKNEFKYNASKKTWIKN